jgi:hypothetical protein
VGERQIQQKGKKKAEAKCSGKLMRSGFASHEKTARRVVIVSPFALKHF